MEEMEEEATNGGGNNWKMAETFPPDSREQIWTV